MCVAVFWVTPSSANPWTKIVAGAPDGVPANVTLLTDGRILVSGPENSPTWNRWWTFAPDGSGAYENSTPVALTSASANGRLFNPSFTLNSGGYMVCGGEYVCPASNLTGCGQTGDRSSCDLFDPVANSWSTLPDMPAKIADTVSVSLADGRPLILAYDNNRAYLFNPSNLLNPWSLAAATYNRSDADSEAGSALLPDGSVFIGSYAFGWYSPDASVWSEAASTSSFVPTGDGEIGPFVMLYGGKLLVLGANGHNGIFDPATNTWGTVDNTPSPFNSGDSPACVERSGRVLAAVNNASDGEGQGSASALYEYIPGAGVGSQWTSVANPTGVSSLASASNRMKMVALPSGQILVTGLQGDGTLWLYNVGGTSDPSWRPTISANPYLFFGNFKVSGRQLNGLTNGSDFGDDQKSPTNYPIVTLTAASGAVTFARTLGFDQRAPRSNWNGMCSFVIPSGLASGTYTVNVTTNGVKSGNSGSVSLPAKDLGPASLATAALL